MNPQDEKSGQGPDPKPQMTDQSCQAVSNSVLYGDKNSAYVNKSPWTQSIIRTSPNAESGKLVLKRPTEGASGTALQRVDPVFKSRASPTASSTAANRPEAVEASLPVIQSVCSLLPATSSPPVQLGAGVFKSLPQGGTLTLSPMRGVGDSAKVKTITVLHHKKVVPSEGTSISQSNASPQVQGQRRVVSLLVSPVGNPTDAPKGPDGNLSVATTTADTGPPRPVHLVTRLSRTTKTSAVTTTSPSQISYTKRLALNQPTPVPVELTLTSPPPQLLPTKQSALSTVPVQLSVGRSPQGQTAAVTTCTVSSSPTMVPGIAKPVRVVTVSPVISKRAATMLTPAVPGQGVLAPDGPAQSADYNRALLEYVNKTMSKSGKEVMIKDGAHLREQIKAAGPDKLLVIDYFSMGSEVCQRIAPQVQQLSRQYNDVLFLKVDIEHTQDAMLMYNVSTTPTFVLLKSGVKMYQSESPDILELEERIKAFRYQPAPSVVLVKQGETTHVVAESPVSYKTGHLDPVTGFMTEEPNTAPNIPALGNVLEKQASKNGGGGKAIKQKQMIKDLLNPMPAFIKRGDESQDVDVENVTEGDLSSNGQTEEVTTRSHEGTNVKSKGKKKNSAKSKKKLQETPQDIGDHIYASTTAVKPAMLAAKQPEGMNTIGGVSSSIDMPSTPASIARAKVTYEEEQILNRPPGGFWDSIRKEMAEDTNQISIGELKLSNKNSQSISDMPLSQKLVANVATATGKIIHKAQQSGLLAKILNEQEKTLNKQATKVQKQLLSVPPKTITHTQFQAITNRQIQAKPSILYKEKVFETTEDLIGPMKPANSAPTPSYFSISCRPTEVVPDSTSPSPNLTNPQPASSNLTNHQSASSLMVCRNPAPETSTIFNKNKRRISHLGETSSREKKAKLINTDRVAELDTKPEKAEIKEENIILEDDLSSKSDDGDNSDNCFVILSRDPTVEDLISAKSRPAVKRPRTNTPAGDVDSSDEDEAVESLQKRRKPSDDVGNGSQMKCNRCSRVFSSVIVVRRHIREVHGLLPEDTGYTAVQKMNADSTSEHTVAKERSSVERESGSNDQPSRSRRSAGEAVRRSMSLESRRSPSVESRHSVSGESKTAQSDAEDGATFCLICNKDLVYPASLKRHNSQAHKPGQPNQPIKEQKPKDPERTCFKCDKEFMSGYSLRCHNAKLHRNDRSPGASTVTKDLGKKVRDPERTCYKCDKVFLTPFSLRCHNAKSHRGQSSKSPQPSNSSPEKKTSESSSVTCEKCHKEFPSIVGLRTHNARVHNSDRAPEPTKDKSEKPAEEETYCHKCNKEMGSVVSLKRHNAAVHYKPPEKRTSAVSYEKPSAEETTCLKCNREFSSKISLIRHKAAVHRNEKTHVSHMSTRPDKKDTTCHRCDMKFRSWIGLVRHKAQAHKGDKHEEAQKPVKKTVKSEAETPSHNEGDRYKCPICKKIYDDRKACKKHLFNKHHTKKPMIVVPKEPKLSPEEEFTPAQLQETKCRKCNVRYSNPHNLRRHVRSAHGIKSGIFPLKKKEEKPASDKEDDGEKFRCKKCTRVYSSSSGLWKHIRKIHHMESGEFPSKKKSESESVSKSSSSGHSSGKHGSSKPQVTDEKPWKCKKCRKAFSNKHSMYGHQLEDHGKICGRLDPEKEAREKKKKEMKSEEPGFTCKCGEKFNDFMRLMMHITLTHKNETAKMAANMGMGAAPKVESESESESESKASSKSKSASESGSESEAESEDESEDKKSAVSSSDSENESESDKKSEEASDSEATGKASEEDEEAKPHACDICGRRYARRCHLSRHQKVIHQMETVWDKLGVKGSDCKECGKKCGNNTRLKKHFAACHIKQMKKDGTLKTLGQKPADVSPTSSQPYTCKKCGKKFVQFSNLRRHSMAAHRVKLLGHPSLYNKSSLFCYKCNKEYTLYGNLFHHMNKAHGTKFDSPASLKRFMERRQAKEQAEKAKAEEKEDSDSDGSESSAQQQTKDGEKRDHSCLKCGRGYSSSGNLLRHYKLVHRLTAEMVQKLKRSSQKAPDNTAKLTANITKPSGTDDGTAKSAGQVRSQKTDCRICNRLILRMRNLRRHMHQEHSMRLVGWRDHDIASQITYLRGELIKGKTLQGPHPCGKCSESRLIKRATGRHNIQWHQDRPAKPVNQSASPKPSPVRGKKLPLKMPTLAKGGKSGAATSQPVQDAPSALPPGAQPEYPCPGCDLGFWRYDTMLRHQFALLPEPSKVCVKCGAGFHSCQSLIHHAAAGCDALDEDSDGDVSRPYKCLVCRESFTLLDTLVKHYKNQHNKYSVHNCRFCTATFRTLSYLRHHIKRRHGHLDTSSADLPFAEAPNESFANIEEEEEVTVTPVGGAWLNKAAHFKSEPGLEESSLNDNLSGSSEVNSASSFGQMIKTEPVDTGYEPVTAGSETGEGVVTSTQNMEPEAQQEYSPSEAVPRPGGSFQCQVCGSVFQLLKSLVQHQKVQHTNIRHRCPRCPAGFHTRIYLLYHCKRQHGIRNPETLQPVGANADTGKKTASRNMTSRAEDSQSGEATKSSYRYNCPMCSAGFRTFHYLSYHLEQIHGINDLDDQAYESMLGKGHSAEGGTRNSLAAGGGSQKGSTGVSRPQGRLKDGRFHCMICGSSFENRKSLHGHHHQQHVKDSIWKCSVCRVNFRSQKYKLYHEKMQHGLKDGKAVADKPQTASSEDNPPPCHTCGAKFSKLRNLKQHVSSQHVVINFTCPDCPAGFTTEYYYTLHRKTRHGFTGPLAPQAPKGKSVKVSARSHECALCGATFPGLWAIRDHVKEKHQVGEAKFTCSICKEGFLKHLLYRAHMRLLHQVTVPDEVEDGAEDVITESGHIVCRFCNGSFTVKNYPQHRSNQHRSMRHICWLCHAGFDRRVFLDNHHKKLHNIQETYTGEYSINLGNLKDEWMKRQQAINSAGSGSMETGPGGDVGPGSGGSGDVDPGPDGDVDPGPGEASRSESQGDARKAEELRLRYQKDPLDIEISLCDPDGKTQPDKSQANDLDPSEELEGDVPRPSAEASLERTGTESLGSAGADSVGKEISESPEDDDRESDKGGNSADQKANTEIGEDDAEILGGNTESGLVISAVGGASHHWNTSDDGGDDGHDDSDDEIIWLDDDDNEIAEKKVISSETERDSEIDKKPDITALNEKLKNDRIKVCETDSVVGDDDVAEIDENQYDKADAENVKDSVAEDSDSDCEIIEETTTMPKPCTPKAQFSIKTEPKDTEEVQPVIEKDSAVDGTNKAKVKEVGGEEGSSPKYVVVDSDCEVLEDDQTSDPVGSGKDASTGSAVSEIQGGRDQSKSPITKEGFQTTDSEEPEIDPDDLESNSVDSKELDGKNSRDLESVDSKDMDDEASKDSIGEDSKDVECEDSRDVECEDSKDSECEDAMDPLEAPQPGDFDDNAGDKSSTPMETEPELVQSKKELIAENSVEVLDESSANSNSLPDNDIQGSNSSPKLENEIVTEDSSNDSRSLDKGGERDEKADELYDKINVTNCELTSGDVSGADKCANQGTQSKDGTDCDVSFLSFKPL